MPSGRAKVFVGRAPLLKVEVLHGELVDIGLLGKRLIAIKAALLEALSHHSGVMLAIIAIKCLPLHHQGIIVLKTVLLMVKGVAFHIGQRIFIRLCPVF